MIGTGPDLLRLLAIPILAWAAWSDYHTRRVDPKLWPILIVIGIVASIWQITQIAPLRTVTELQILTRIVLVPPIIGFVAAVLYNLGSLGGADVKALFTISLLYPATVQYELPLLGVSFPVFENPFLIMALTIIVNAFIFATFYPLIMWHRNLKREGLSRSIIDSELKSLPELTTTAGQLKGKNADGDTFILDLDTLRMYLRWRGLDIQELKGRGESLRNPETITTTYKINDGAIESSADAGYFATPAHFEPERTNIADTSFEPPEQPTDDPWGATNFFQSINHDGYGATPQDLRNGLDHLIENDQVRVLPAFPLIVPLFIGLLVSLTIGDLAAAWVFGFLA